MLCLCGLGSTHTCTCIINMHIMWTKFQKGTFYCKTNKVLITFLLGGARENLPRPLSEFLPPFPPLGSIM